MQVQPLRAYFSIGTDIFCMCLHAAAVRVCMCVCECVCACVRVCARACEAVACLIEPR